MRTIGRARSLVRCAPVRGRIGLANDRASFDTPDTETNEQFMPSPVRAASPIPYTPRAAIDEFVVNIAHSCPKHANELFTPA
ncbi:hypothetical protein C27AD_19138 [Salinisphaera hydrothermalis C27AD]